MTIQTPISNIAAALAKAQKKIKVADRHAINSEHKSRFADMESVIEACRDALAEQEISILQPLGGSASELLVTTVLLHSTGEFLESEFRIHVESTSDFDAVKSLITQARRYSLMGMLCIATADDDGAKPPAKKPEPKAPVQNPGPVVEKHEAEAPEETAPETPEVSTVETNDEWKEVVVHVGTETSPCKGKTLGELDHTLRKWLAEKVLPTLGKTKRDRTLAAAIAESVKHPYEAPTAPETPPEPERAVEQPPSAKKEASEETPEAAEPMDWRSVVAHNFKPRPTITLGEIADSKLGEFAKDFKKAKEWDGAAILRGMKTEGIANIQSRPQTAKDKLLVNAILAANEELDFRDKIIGLFKSAKVTPEKAAAMLVGSGQIDEGQTLLTAPVETLRSLCDHWGDVEKMIKEAK